MKNLYLYVISLMDVATLPENEYEIDLVVLHLLYDYSFKEIAKQYNVSTSVISSKYRRTIKKVKQYYKGE